MLENPYYTSDPWDYAIPTGKLIIRKDGESDSFLEFTIDSQENVEVHKTPFDDESETDHWIDMVCECEYYSETHHTVYPDGNDDSCTKIIIGYIGDDGHSTWEPTPAQLKEISLIEIECYEVYHQRRKDFLEENRGKHIELFKGLFEWCEDREGDFLCEGECGDDWTYYQCCEKDCPIGWHKIDSAIDFWRKDGRLGITIRTVDEDGDWDFAAEWDEESIRYDFGQDFLHDYWGHLTPNGYFRGLVEYHCHVARTGEDPLNEWYRAHSYDENIQAAKRDLEYLKK